MKNIKTTLMRLIPIIGPCLSVGSCLSVSFCFAMMEPGAIPPIEDAAIPLIEDAAFPLIEDAAFPVILTREMVQKADPRLPSAAELKGEKLLEFFPSRRDQIDALTHEVIYNLLTQGVCPTEMNTDLFLAPNNEHERARLIFALEADDRPDMDIEKVILNIRVAPKRLDRIAYSPGVISRIVAMNSTTPIKIEAILPHDSDEHYYDNCITELGKAIAQRARNNRSMDFWYTRPFVPVPIPNSTQPVPMEIEIRKNIYGMFEARVFNTGFQDLVREILEIASTGFVVEPRTLEQTINAPENSIYPFELIPRYLVSTITKSIFNNHIKQTIRNFPRGYMEEDIENLIDSLREGLNLAWDLDLHPERVTITEESPGEYKLIVNLPVANPAVAAVA